MKSKFCCDALDSLLAASSMRFELTGAYRELFRFEDSVDDWRHELSCPACGRPLVRSLRKEFFDRLDWNGGSSDDVSEAWIRDELARDPYIFERMPLRGDVIAFAGADAVGLVLGVADGGAKFLLAVWLGATASPEFACDTSPSEVVICSTWPLRRGDWTVVGWRGQEAAQLARRSVMEMNSIPLGADGATIKHWFGPDLGIGRQLTSDDAQLPGLLMVDDSGYGPQELYEEFLGTDPPNERK